MYDTQTAPSMELVEAARIMREAVRERWRPNGRRECATCKTIRNRNRPKKGDR